MKCTRGGGPCCGPPWFSLLLCGSSPLPIRGRAGCGTEQGQLESECNEGRAHPEGCSPVTPPPASSWRHGGVHRAGGCSTMLGAASHIAAWHLSSSNGPFPPPRQRSWEGGGQHTPMHPQNPPPGPFPPPPGLPNEPEPTKDPGRAGTWRGGFTISGRVRGGGLGVSGCGGGGGVRAGRCPRGWRRGDSPSCGWSGGPRCSSPAAAS